MDCAVVRNSFARESFRDVADEDYIAARCAYRLGLMNHFLWSGLQAIEKYLKAFLLINEVDTRDLLHDIEAAYRRAVGIAEIGLSLPAPELALLLHLNRHGENRYREISTYTKGDELPVFDSLVWNLRRYCKPLKTTLRLRGGTVKDMFQLNLDQLNSLDFQAHPYRFKLIGGYLEKVLEAPRTDLRRVHLVWGNRYFGPGKAQRIRRSHSVNNYMSRYPEEVDCLRELVRFPKSHLAEIDRMKAQKRRI
jgi:hypothetical protein